MLLGDAFYDYLAFEHVYSFVHKLYAIFIATYLAEVDALKKQVDTPLCQ